MPTRAEFVERASCIACGEQKLRELAGGSYADEPVRGILLGEAWGDCPLPYVEHERWSFVQCDDCGQRFHRRILAPEWMDRLYGEWETQDAMEAFLADKRTPAWHQAHAEVAVAHVLRLLKMTADLRQGAAMRLLDFGCGWAEFVAQASAFGADAAGIDFAPDRQSFAKVAIHGSLEEWDAQQGGAGKLHAATLFQVLEHLVDPRSVLEELAARMHAGAILIAEVPDTTGVTDIRSREDFFAIAPLGHINGFTPDSLRKLARRAGFEAVQPAAAWVTHRWSKVLKVIGRRALGRALRPTTHQYFRRVP